MEKSLNRSEILKNLKLLADWIRVKDPNAHFELVVVGGAGMAIEGFKDQTKDIDVLWPETLPRVIVNGVEHIGRIRGLSPEWLNCHVANMFLETKASKSLPAYFAEVSRSIDVSENLKVNLIGRQALISLKLYAATPSYRKHTSDMEKLHPSAAEISEAVCFVLSLDHTDVRKDDLRFVLNDLGFDFDDIYGKIKRGDPEGF